MKKLICLFTSFMVCALFLVGCAPKEYKEIANQANEIFEDDYNSDDTEFKAKATSDGIFIIFTYNDYKDIESYIEDIKCFGSERLKTEFILGSAHQLIYSELGFRDRVIVQIEAKNGDVLYQYEYDNYDSFREEKINNIN